MLIILQLPLCFGKSSISQPGGGISLIGVRKSALVSFESQKSKDKLLLSSLNCPDKFVFIDLYLLESNDSLNDGSFSLTLGALPVGVTSCECWDV